MMPIKKPMLLPRAMGPIDCLSSARDGINSRSVGFFGSAGMFFALVIRISEMPNKPTATGTMPMPSASSTTSNAKRV